MSDITVTGTIMPDLGSRLSVTHFSIRGETLVKPVARIRKTMETTTRAFRSGRPLGHR